MNIYMNNYIIILFILCYLYIIVIHIYYVNKKLIKNLMQLFKEVVIIKIILNSEICKSIRNYFDIFDYEYFFY